MAKRLTKKQNRLAISVWVLIAAIMILSNNVVQFLGMFGLGRTNANILIVVFVVMLALYPFYHREIAIELNRMI